MILEVITQNLEHFRESRNWHTRCPELTVQPTPTVFSPPIITVQGILYFFLPTKKIGAKFGTSRVRKKRCQGYLSKGNLYCVAPIQLPGAYVIRYWSVGKKCCERRPGELGSGWKGAMQTEPGTDFEGCMEHLLIWWFVCRWKCDFFIWDVFLGLDSKSRKDVRIVDDFNLLLKSLNNAFVMCMTVSMLVLYCFVPIDEFDKRASWELTWIPKMMVWKRYSKKKGMFSYTLED